MKGVGCKFASFGSVTDMLLQVSHIFFLSVVTQQCGHVVTGKSLQSNRS